MSDARSDLDVRLRTATAGALKVARATADTSPVDPHARTTGVGA